MDVNESEARRVLIVPEGLDPATDAYIVRLKPGDVLVLMCPRPLSAEEVHEFQTRAASIIRDRLGVECLVLDQGMRVGVLRKEAE